MDDQRQPPSGQPAVISDGPPVFGMISSFESGLAYV